jgi:hypothetical protein
VLQVDMRDDVLDDLGADVPGLLLHLLHQPGALDRVGESGIVLDVGGDRQLPAGLQALYQNRLQVGARGVDRGGVAGRTGTDDQNLGVAFVGHIGRGSLAACVGSRAGWV